MGRLGLGLLGCLLVGGCSDDAATDGAMTSPDSGTMSNGTEPTESTDEPEPDLPVEPSLAHDIDISLVEVNQGVAVPVVIEGEWVGALERNAPIVAGRKALIRAYWTRAPDFTDREIEARLTLEYPDGEIVVESQSLVIDQEAFPGDLARSFYFDLIEDEVVPGMLFSVSLWDIEAEFAAMEPPSVEPVSPRDGVHAVLGVQPEPLEMEIVIVPVQVEWPGCSTTVPVNDLLPIFEDMMFMKNPTQSVTLSVHPDVLMLTEELVSLWDMFELLQEYRVNDAAAPNQYYYALLDGCTGDIGGAGGMAYSATGPNKDLGWQRVATGLWFGDDQWAADTFVHEVGHLQGLEHVFCPGGGADNPDPAYPHPDGQIGVWGFGLRDFKLRSPTAAHDFMSYCYDGNWSSDWTWSKTFERIRTLTSWSYEGNQPTPGQHAEILIGLFPSDGAAPKWWTTRGRVPELDDGQTRVAHATTKDGRELELPALRQQVSDGQATVISVELPAGTTGTALTSVELDGERLPVVLRP